jgi:predicted nucleic acid-binding protein
VIFVDTAAFYALLDGRDPNHDRARIAFEAMSAADEALISHEYVLVETTGLVQHRLGFAPLRTFVDDVLPIVTIEWVGEALHAEARAALLAGGRRHISLVDWTSFLVMRRLGIDEAFTFDQDFIGEGFRVIPGE